MDFSIIHINGSICCFVHITSSQKKLMFCVVVRDELIMNSKATETNLEFKDMEHAVTTLVNKISMQYYIDKEDNAKTVKLTIPKCAEFSEGYDFIIKHNVQQTEVLESLRFTLLQVYHNYRLDDLQVSMDRIMLNLTMINMEVLRASAEKKVQLAAKVASLTKLAKLYDDKYTYHMQKLAEIETEMSNAHKSQK